MFPHQATPWKMDSTASPPAKLAFKAAFDRFEAVIAADNPTILDSINGTTLSDVYSAVIEIEKELAQRRSLKNMRRLRPFLEGLERYSRAVEVLCNGTPYLSCVWVCLRRKKESESTLTLSVSNHFDP